MQTTEESSRLIHSSKTVELMAFSRDGDPLALVEISKGEALHLVAIPLTMGHVFRATLVDSGRVVVEAVDAHRREGGCPPLGIKESP